MRQYLDAVKEILDKGTRKPNRTSVDTLSTFNINYEIDLQRGFPLLTTKAISFKNIVVEMLWFLSGRTDIGILRQHKCRIWEPWADKETGNVPSAYGNFWRQFPVHTMEKFADWEPRPTLSFNDQIKWMIGELQRNPMSRRLVVSAWAPQNAQTSKLPPCHCLFVVNVQNMVADPLLVELKEAMAKYPSVFSAAASPRSHRVGAFLQSRPELTRERVEQAIDLIDSGEALPTEQRLCLHLTQRSCDIALGVPYNIASYALLMHLLSRFSGIPVGIFAHTLVDAHAYTSKADGSQADMDHVPGLREQLSREPRKLPNLYISPEIRTLEDVERLMGDDVSTDEVMRHFVLDGYEPHPAITFKVAE